MSEGAVRTLGGTTAQGITQVALTRRDTTQLAPRRDVTSVFVTRQEQPCAKKEKVTQNSMCVPRCHGKPKQTERLGWHQHGGLRSWCERGTAGTRQSKGTA